MIKYLTNILFAGLRLLPRQQLVQQHHPVLGAGPPRRAAPHPHGRHHRAPRREQHERAGQPGLHRETAHHHGVPQQQPDPGGDQLLPRGSDRGEKHSCDVYFLVIRTNIYSLSEIFF